MSKIHIFTNQSIYETHKVRQRYQCVHPGQMPGPAAHAHGSVGRRPTTLSQAHTSYTLYAFSGGRIEHLGHGLMSEFDIKAKEEINQLASCRRKMSFNAEYTYKVAALAGIALARAGPKSGKKTLEVTAGIDTVDDAANSRVSRGILKSQLDSVDRGIHRAIPAAPPVVRTAERDISPVMLPSASLGVKLRLIYS